MASGVKYNGGIEIFDVKIFLFRKKSYFCYMKNRN